MSRKAFILIILSLFFNTAFAEEFTRKLTIVWNDPERGELFQGYDDTGWIMSFDGAVNHGDMGCLPVFYQGFPLKWENFEAEITVTEALYEPVSLPDASVTMADADYLGERVVIFYETSVIRKKPWIDVYLLPLRLNPDSGEPEKLISCNLKVSIDYLPDTRQNSLALTNTSQSVLSSGEWYKISADQSGIHIITYEDLQNFGINVEAIDPRNIRIHGNGGRMLSESTSQPRPDDLIENAIFVSGESDGRFDPEDYILFYVSGPVQWKYSPFYQQFEHEVNLYTDKVCYFLTVQDKAGKRISIQPATTGDPVYYVNTTNDYACHELDSVNLIKSGKEWYGEVFNHETIYEFFFRFPSIDMTKSAYFKANFVARSTQSSTFTVLYEGDYLVSQEIGSVEVGSSVYARTMTTQIAGFTPKDTVLRFTIEYDKPNQTSTGWLNYIVINAVSGLDFSGGQRTFRDVSSVGPGNIVQFQIASNLDEFQVWDITDPSGVSAMETFQIPGGAAIKVLADSLREFVVFNGQEYYHPEYAGKIANQNLHGLSPANMVIVVHPPLMEEAIRLADFHRQYSHLTVNVVTPEQIYNEFSSGTQDVSAIRDFMKMLYDRSSDDSGLRYLLLFGDASYDYQDRIPEDNNLVPTFQSMESLKTASSFVTDDFYGCLDYGEGSNASGTVDIGIGRFPVRTLDEAKIVVDKVIHYSTASLDITGNWRNEICLVSDDEDNNIHLNQVEELTEIIDSTATCFNIGKIYLDAYLQQKSPVGDRYPDASAAIDKAVSDGLLIINYTGHGGETGWAGEKVLDMPMILAWTNYDRMPAFVTATCEFSRFDDPGLVSAGEWVILNPNGGGIGLFTTTRLAYAQSNVALNKRFYQAAFERDPVTGEYPRMGDLMKHAKTPSSQNIKNFVLLGDPAVMLAYPFQNVRTLSIDNQYSGKETDTLQALSHVTITGQVEDIRGNLLENFRGKVYPTIYDKPVLYHTRANDKTSRVTDFYIQNKVLYQGEVTVTDGRFSFTFIVPKDISYQYGLGKISYYATDTNTFTDAQGYTEVYIGGADNLSDIDEQGPEIMLYLNDTTFVSGNVTTSSPILLARLYDESGINTVGNGIGHDLTAILDGMTQNPVILNDYFTPDPDSYQSGWVSYPLGNLAAGSHTISFKAWDIYNNSSESLISFVIDTISPLYIKKVINYPNPFREGTNFCFTHNKPGSSFDVTIEIFTLDGKPVTTLYYGFTGENLQSSPLYWNGRDDDGNEPGSGIYLFRLKAVADRSRTAQVSQKMMIIR